MTRILFVNNMSFLVFLMIGQKGMTFDHDFGYSFPYLKKREEEKKNQ